MQKPTPAEHRKALDALLPLEESPLEVLDRSTIEGYAVCPFAAHAAEQKRVLVANTILNAGIEIHDCLSRVTMAWIESGGAMNPVDLRNELETELRSSRPDVQPEVLDGCLASAWSWAQFVHHIHPANILGFDGGEALTPPRSGQLAIDFEGLGVRVTSELDLIWSDPRIEIGHWLDYKTGHKIHTATEAADAFQFQLHADLLLHAFPTWQAAKLIVWNTRRNQRAYEVTFDRSHQPEWRARVRNVLGARHEAMIEVAAGRNAPCWPSLEKCSICDAALLCPEVTADVRDVAADPVAALGQLVAIDARRDALAKALAARVDADGRDIVGDGFGFGRSKPVGKRKASVYEIER